MAVAEAAAEVLEAGEGVEEEEVEMAVEVVFATGAALGEAREAGASIEEDVEAEEASRAADAMKVIDLEAETSGGGAIPLEAEEAVVVDVEDHPGGLGVAAVEAGGATAPGRPWAAPGVKKLC